MAAAMTHPPADDSQNAAAVVGEGWGAGEGGGA
jgi:hypothetical protein